jgi:hypothetical protein
MDYFTYAYVESGIILEWILRKWDARIIFKCIFMEEAVITWAGINWSRVESDGGMPGKYHCNQSNRR